MADRRFFSTTITLTILSEDRPLAGLDLSDLGNAVTDGDCVLMARDDTSHPVTGPEMARLLVQAGSEPGFFGLDDFDPDDPYTLCEVCQVDGHDQCPLTVGCACCDNTAAQLADGA